MANTDYILSAQIKLLGTNREVVSCGSNCPRLGISSRGVYDPFRLRRLDEVMPSDELKDYGDEQRRVQTVNGFQKFETKLRITSDLAQRIDVYVFIETSNFHLIVDNVSMRLASPIPSPVNAPVSQPVVAPVVLPIPVPIVLPMPVMAPLSPPMSAPVTPPVTLPVSAPITPPISAPVTPPVTLPIPAPITL